MHKLKKATAALRSYLGRDTDGIEFLNEVERIANDLRKRLAAEIDRADAVAEKKLKTEGDLIRANSKIHELRTELAKEQALKTQRDQRIDKLEYEKELVIKKCNHLIDLDGPVDQDEIDDLGNHATVNPNFYGNNLKHCVRQLTVWRTYCPKPMGDNFHHSNERRTPLVYSLADIIPRLSSIGFTRLGMFVAVMALTGFPCIIYAVGTEYDETDGKAKSVQRGFRRWFLKHNMKFTDVQEQIHTQDCQDNFKATQKDPNPWW